jgi:hypothetical protein
MRYGDYISMEETIMNGEVIDLGVERLLNSKFNIERYRYVSLKGIVDVHDYYIAVQQIEFGQTYPVMLGWHLTTGMKHKAGYNSYAEL